MIKKVQLISKWLLSAAIQFPTFLKIFSNGSKALLWQSDLPLKQQLLSLLQTWAEFSTGPSLQNRPLTATYPIEIRHIGRSFRCDEVQKNGFFTTLEFYSLFRTDRVMLKRPSSIPFCRSAAGLVKIAYPR